ncbi:Glycosyl transferase family 8 [Natronincola peptidivorans]|uniref:Glycosyl transferase family 8 n=1 Tax=Natronincola peptidivorans TaxID=426128 RepID=A0A1H9YTP0_9FIRM|nr:glycosyltransferase [Natronincola peptidivorans]SES72535.1 Glycosyl transferase family 8 [Natronincola peptidivorans]
MKHYYCSTFSKDYIYRGILLYNSLLKYDKNFHFFIICLHDEVKELIKKMNLEKATAIALSDIEQEDKDLLKVKKTRNDKEYIWTSKASVMLYLLNKFKALEHIVWLDGDTIFYSDPQPIFDEWGDQYSIMLTKERWRKGHRQRNYITGIYNTGFMGFKRDKYSFNSLEWLRKKLIEWCYDKRENGLWSDQLYINNWHKKFQRVGIIKNIGVNLNPYIVQRCKIKKKGDAIYVNGEKLIFYHAYGFKYYDGTEFDLCSYGLSLSDDVIKEIYLPYIYATRDIVKQINSVANNFYKEDRPKNKLIRNYFNLKINEDIYRNRYQLCTLTTKDYLVQALALYNSLKNGHSKFHLWILCVDDIAYELLSKMNLEKATLVSLDNIKNIKVKKAKEQRKIHEFCWTLKAPFISYILSNNYNLCSVLYLDSDLFFYRDIKALYKDWGGKSVYLTQLPIGPKWIKKVGQYSAGLIGFKRDVLGKKCLNWWHKQCLEWCYDINEKNRWGDQKYLNFFNKICSNIKVSNHKGINPGPWNIWDMKKASSVYMKDDGIFFNKYPLICYHFSGFRVFNEMEYELCNRKKMPQASQIIYAAYIKEVSKIMMEIKKIDKTFIDIITSPPSKHKPFNYYSLHH